jgi:predicted lipoprotein
MSRNLYLIFTGSRGVRDRRMLPACPALLLAALLAAMAPAGCKLVKNPDPAELAAKQAASQGGGADVATLWTAQVLPHMNETATDLAVLKPAIAGGLDAAGQANGFRAKSEGAPWNFPVKAEGTVVAAKTDTRAATADIDIDGDSKADATVQLGPVIRGTTLRDVQPFIDFTAYRDQIAFAELARGLNDQAYENALSAVPKEALVGKKVTLVGAFTMKAASDPILITPVSFAVAP